MKKSSIWIGVSISTLTALANGPADDQKSKIVSSEINYKKTLPTKRVWVNADGSAHIVDTDGNVTYISSQTLDLIKKINPGNFASLPGSNCVGKSK